MVEVVVVSQSRSEVVVVEEKITEEEVEQEVIENLQDQHLVVTVFHREVFLQRWHYLYQYRVIQ